jgi:hypothetical protein
MSSLYREIVVWKRVSDKRAIRYQCFEDLSTRRFAVQSGDWLCLPVNEEVLRQHERQAVELFVEKDVGERCGWFGSIERAIEAHDAVFS